jgi:hypothetical protein
MPRMPEEIMNPTPHKITIAALELTTQNTTTTITPGTKLATRVPLQLGDGGHLPAGSLVDIQGILVLQHPHPTDQGVLIAAEFVIIALFGGQQIQLPTDAFVPAPSSYT